MNPSQGDTGMIPDDQIRTVRYPFSIENIFLFAVLFRSYHFRLFEHFSDSSMSSLPVGLKVFLFFFSLRNFYRPIIKCRNIALKLAHMIFQKDRSRKLRYFTFLRIF